MMIGLIPAEFERAYLLVERPVVYQNWARGAKHARRHIACVSIRFDQAVHLRRRVKRVGRIVQQQIGRPDLRRRHAYFGYIAKLERIPHQIVVVPALKSIFKDSK